MVRSRRARWLAPLVLCAFIGTSCVVSSRTEKVLVSPANAQSVSTAARAHLRDGSVLTFGRGFTLDATRASGMASREDAARGSRSGEQLVTIPRDSILGFEVFDRSIDPLKTLLYNVPIVAAEAFGAALLAIAIFGSCPTVYADSAHGGALQAESFSYSIAPLLANRDVDRLSVMPDANGVMRLILKNEALETHHLDHTELVEVRPRADEVATPSPRGGAIAMSRFAPEALVRDDAGRDVSRLVARFDESVFASDDRVLDRGINGGPTEDHLYITIPRRDASDSIGLLFRARSSLFTTSVLYDELMARQGSSALDWMGKDLSRLGYLTEVASWYTDNFGMRVDVWRNGSWQPAGRLLDFGPTAWRTLGLMLPTPSGDDSLRIRLSFPADGVRIDQLSVAYGVRRLDERHIPLARATDWENKPREDIVRMLARPDGRDLQTNPGTRLTLEFDAGTSPEQRVFFFAAEGYYTEWIRPSWMVRADSVKRFSPTTSSMHDMLRRWKASRDSLEANFFKRRVPVT